MSDQTPRSRAVFISYSSKNKEWADDVCAVLEKHGLRCWIAPRNIPPGSEYMEAIIGGIAACKIMVLVFSAHANASPQVRKEVERAISKGKTVLPFRVEDVLPEGSLEYALGNTHWLDGFKPPWERQLERLARAVKALLAGKSPSKPEHPPVPPAAPTTGRRMGTLLIVAVVIGALAFGVGEDRLKQAVRWIAAKGIADPDKPAPPPPIVDVTLITNTLGMKLKLIPAGEFEIGSDAFDPDAQDDEKVDGKKHQVRITKPFYLGTTEVTVGQFRKFVEKASYKTEAERDGKGYGWNEAKGANEQNPKYTWRSPGFKQEDDHPVVLVSYNDAVAFCDWLSKEEGQTYRLPSEAEWEYSCRAGQASRYWFGEDPEGLAAVGNVADATAKVKFPDWTFAIKAKDGFVFTAPVGHYRANGFGLFDMHGNVREWCADYYDSAYYAKSPSADPLNSTQAAFQVFRGGSWDFFPQFCRSAYRGWSTPVFRINNLGFRVARVSSKPDDAPREKSFADREKAAGKPAPPPPIVDVTLITNKQGMKLKLIPAGEFLMGSDDSDPDARDDEKIDGKKHQVRITKPFYLGTTEVTVGQFRKFVEKASYKTEAERDGKGFGWNEAKGANEQNPKYTWRSPGFKQEDDHPVVLVSYNDAVAFCDWLSKEEGQTYRLPSEAEWEYSCRAGQASRFWFGDDVEGLAAVGNVADATAKEKYPHWMGAIKAKDGFVFTAPVGHFRANGFGLFDMHGNVFEWCADYYDSAYYAKSPSADPLNSTQAVYRVNRGGGWGTYPQYCPSAYRSGSTPDYRSNYLGLRLARVPSKADGAPRDKVLADHEKAAGKPAPPPPIVDVTLITNTLGMKLKLIPAGEFLMGSDASDPDARGDEKVDGKKHQVRITKPFYLGTTEVTVGQFRKFMEKKSYKTEAERDGKGGYGWNEAKGSFELDPKYTWRSPGFKQEDDHPVVNVSYNDAVAYCEWLSREEGQTYRLPSEAEWEYGCRAGQASRFWFGDDVEGLAAVGNVADGTAKSKYPAWTYAITAPDGFVFTAPVGQFRANGFGLFDMHGNVFEWCADWYASNYYAKSPSADPLNSNQAAVRVLRGGSWSHIPRDCRSAYRSWSAPADRVSNIGFRVARVQ